MALIGRAKSDLEQNVFHFPGYGDLPLTNIIPNSWANERDNRGWTKYTMSNYQSETRVERSKTSLKAGGGFNLGFWRAEGGFHHDNERKEMDFQTSDLKVSFEYMIADVHSAVVKPTLLNLNNWFLYGDYPKHTISNGTMGQQLPAGGKEVAFLPSMITGLILTKNLKIHWKDWQHQWKEETTKWGANTSFGWGPWGVSGSYANDKYKMEANTRSQSQGLSTEGIQLIGYVSQIMPPSPQLSSRDYMKEIKPSEDDE